MAGAPASDPKLGIKIRQARERKRLTQAQLAKAVGVTPAWVNRWEVGEHPPTAPHLRTLAEALDVSVDWLLDRDVAEKLEREWPEGYSVMRRSYGEMSPQKRLAMLKIMETLFDTDFGEQERPKELPPEHK